MMTLSLMLKTVKLIDDELVHMEADLILSKNSEKKMKQAALQTLLYLTIHMIVLLFALAQFVIPQKGDENFFYVSHLFAKCFPNQKTIWEILCIPCFAACYLPATVPLYQLIYGFTKMRLATYALKDHIENINSGYEKRQHLNADPTYHKVVRERLVRILKFHSRLFL